MFRDKTYLRTNNDMLFNVTGYRHPKDHVYASLKYVGGAKWTHGYAAAKVFLAAEHPTFVDQYIRVPREEIQEAYCPQLRWTQLKNAKSLSPLHREALDLGTQLREILQIPESRNGDLDTEFGITDSLLWGDGHAASDIDLVVIGITNARRILELGSSICDNPGFARPDPSIMTAPYGMTISEWPLLLSRKLHMGCYRGRLFSLRCVPSLEDLETQPVELPVHFTDDPRPTEQVHVVNFEIDDASESLCFPAVYRDRRRNELVDYSVVYEGVFRKGDVVRCACYQEEIAFFNSARRVSRHIIQGACQLTGHAGG